MNILQPWHWRQIPLDCRTGSQVFETLFLPEIPQPHSLMRNPLNYIATLLESPASTDNYYLSRYSICAGTPRFVNGKPRIWNPPLGEVLGYLRQDYPCRNESLSEGLIPPSEIPFSGGWLGWLGYDIAWEIERLPFLNSDPLPFPISYWYEPESFAVLDHQQQRLWLATTDVNNLEEMERKLENYSRNSEIFIPRKSSVNPRFNLSPEAYKIAVEKAKKYIYSGDIFQANLSLRFAAQTTANSWSIYRALQQINPSPFASYWQTPWGTVISCSPERLVQLSGTKVQTRPIAGTRQRGATPEEDEELATELLNNEKEIAEHIMLVDLERNDLGRVCEWGSVEVQELLTIERYSHVMHLVSNIVGKLQKGWDAIDLIRATFPGGTITGCPKVRCLEIIEELEPVRRNLFYGSCGYLDWRGNLDLNILIRTLLLAPIDNSGEAMVWGQVGAGIVADSDPQREWYESLQKAKAQIQALNLGRGDG